MEKHGKVLEDGKSIQDLFCSNISYMHLHPVLSHCCIKHNMNFF